MNKCQNIQDFPLEKDGKTVGCFYNSMDKKYHLAEYIPYCMPPERYLCNIRGNFSAVKIIKLDYICKLCLEKCLKKDL